MHSATAPLELYTLPALARAWKVCESKLRKDAARGALEVVRIGRAVRVTPAEVERYLREGGRPGGRERPAAPDGRTAAARR